MSKKLFILLLIFVFCALSPACRNQKKTNSSSFDVVILGGTSAGVAAAVQTARMGKTVCIIEPGQHLGGLSSGGLGQTDVGRNGKASTGGISREFYERIYTHYQKENAWIQQKAENYTADSDIWHTEKAWWKFEPHVAEAIFKQMLIETGVKVFYSQRLNLNDAVIKEGNTIKALKTEDGTVFVGKMFIDATYEGDLMAKSGITYTVGREANAKYNETLNGVQTNHAKYHQFENDVDPYIIEGDPTSGLLPRISAQGPGKEFTGDKKVQAYCFRLCLTDAPENKVDFPKPAGYDPNEYILLARYLKTGWKKVFGNNKAMPNRKTDMNNHGAFSSDNIGRNYDYPEADYQTRDTIIAAHEKYQKGLMCFLANDPRVPADLQAEVKKWGLSADEFVDNNNWPHQLYIREARRMVSDYVMTEHDCTGSRTPEDPIGMGAYQMDSHNTQRYVDVDGNVRNEGDVEVRVPKPYLISYGAIIPSENQCQNLLVPVCLSASHIAYGSIRMEPVFMILGQSAATAACLTIDENCSVQQLDYQKLQKKLIADGQRLQWTQP